MGAASSVSFIFEAVFLALLLVIAMARLSIPLGNRLRLVDLPQSAPHKQHARPTPLVGGFVLASTLLLSSLFFGVTRAPQVLATFAAGLVVFAFGLWDDFKCLSPLVKLVGQLISVVVLVGMGVSIQIFESPEFFLKTTGFLAVFLDWLVTAVWVVGITNAFNFVDSMDGLAVGLGGMAAAFFVLVTLGAGQLALSQYSALILGICIGLYFFNSSPAQLFLGDSGAQTLGFVLAVLAIAYRPVGVNQSSSWFVPILLLGVPIFDTSLVVFSRLRRGRPIYTSALDHTYHRLTAAGWNPNRAVLAMQLAALLLGCLAFLVLTRPPLVANLIFGAVLLLGVWAVIYLDRKKLGDKRV